MKIKKIHEIADAKHKIESYYKQKKRNKINRLPIIKTLNKNNVDILAHRKINNEL
jgi:hypothetical protein